MHDSCFAWIKARVEDYDLAQRACFEVGSRNVNGSVRSLFHGPYLGIDLEPGPGVDVVGDIEEDHMRWRIGLDWPCVVSTEMLEHCRHPFSAVAHMARSAGIGGHVLLTARGFDHRGAWLPHDHPEDYWRFSNTSMRLLAEDAGLTVLRVDADPEGPGWFLAAVK